MLRDWLRAMECNTDNFRSRHQAHEMVRIILAKVRGAIPNDEHQAMLRLQRLLCQPGYVPKATTKYDRPERGTFGPASPTRQINVADYVAAQQRAASS